MVEIDRIFRAMIVLMMEAVNTSEISLHFHQATRRNLPEGNHIHTRGRENLKSHQEIPLLLCNSKFQYRVNKNTFS
jgi:hypothetical protein